MYVSIFSLILDMDSQRKILSSLIFTILVVGFLSFYFFDKKSVDAASLVFCVNASNSSDYYVIDDTYACPAGYNKMDSDFNLILNNYGNTTNTATNTNNTNTGNTNTNNTNTNPAWNYLDPNYTNTTNQNTNNSNQNLGANTNANTETVIPVDPSLASGPFVTLDPTDYPYCVTLTHDLYYGVTDAASGRDVSAIQSYLTDRGFIDTGATGFYGRITELGVRKFQYRNQIDVTGTVTSDTRDILKELTCVQYPKVTYVDKPISPSVVKAVAKKVTTTKTTTKPVSTTKTTVIPPTKVDTATKTVTVNTNTVPTTGISTLSSYGGNMYLSQKNNLYFSYLTKSVRPYICINLNNTDCTQSSSYGPVVDGIVKGYYEVVSVSGKWSFNIYNGSIWGSVGDRVKIYLKDSQAANTVSIYSINILN